MKPATSSIPLAFLRAEVLEKNTLIKRALCQTSFFLFFIVFLLCHSIAFSQTIKGSYSYRRNQIQLDQLFNLLKEDKLDEIPACFFGQKVVYDDKLADLVIFIDRSGKFTATNEDEHKPKCLEEDRSVRFCLTKGGRNRAELFGEKNVYVMIFVAEDQNDRNSIGKQVTKSEKAEQIIETTTESGAYTKCEKITTNISPKDPISVFLSPLDWTPGSGEFVLFSIVKSFANIFSGLSVGTGEKAASAADSMKPASVPMFEVGSNGETRLFFGFLRVPLNENTINRILAIEQRGDAEQLHVATFGNYSGSIITSSIGLMATILKSDSLDSRTPVDAFIFGHLYLKRPQLPAPRYPNNSARAFTNKISFSLVVGTKLSKNLFDDLFFGASVGHFLSTVGFVAGVNYRTFVTEKDGVTTTRRKPRFCFGITFML